MTVREIKRNLKEIDNIFDLILDADLNEELIKLQFEDIRNMVNYSEELALKGKSAIESL